MSEQIADMAIDQALRDEIYEWARTINPMLPEEWPDGLELRISLSANKQHATLVKP